MMVQFSDPHKALSWDGMHAHDHGLGGKHMWPAVQKYIKQYGRDGPAKVDYQYVAEAIELNIVLTWRFRAQSFPTWRKLCHFNKIMDVGYTDATKLRDLVKVSTYDSDWLTRIIIYYYI
jgi:hypothetical protein